MADERAEQDVAQQAVQALRRGLGDKLVAVVLFGSRARGDAREDGDWDLLVIARDLPRRVLKRHSFLRQMLPLTGEVSLLAKTPEEFEAAVGSIYLDIATDGVILYDPHGYAAMRLNLLRRMIQLEGWMRRRSEVGDMWYRDRTDPHWTLQWPEVQLTHAT